MSEEEAKPTAERMLAAMGLRRGNPELRQRLGLLTGRVESQDDSDQFSALIELCEGLNMANDEYLIALPLDRLVPALVAILKKDYNPELVLLASRALTYLVDAAPQSAMLLSRASGVDVLCDKLRNIIDIDVAEQALTALEKVASEIPTTILEVGGLSALLCNIDFFSLATQRKAVAAVAAVSKKVSQGNFTSVQEVLPVIHNFVQHEDAKISESALVALLRIVEGVRGNEEFVLQSFGEMTPTVLEILDKRLLDSCFNAALKLLSAVIRSSPKASIVFLEFGLMFTIKGLLEAGRLQGGTGGSPQTPDRSTNSDSQGTGPGSPLLFGSLSAQMTPPQNKTSMGKMLSTEHVTEVFHIVAELLPPVTNDFMKFWSADSVIAFRSPPNGNGDDMEDDEGEDEGPSLSDEEVAEKLKELLTNAKFLMKVDSKHSKCRPGVHSCDMCGETHLQPWNWFRCNELADFDMCGRCAVQNGVPYCEENKKSFTYMQQMFPDSPGPKQSVATLAATPAQNPRRELLSQSGHLIERIAECLGTVIRVCSDFDSLSVRALAIEFVCRILDFAETGVLRKVLMDVPLCEFLRLSFEVADQHVSVLPPIIYCASVLLEKLDDIYHNIFLREGIVHAITKVKVAASQPAASQTSDDRLDVLCSTSRGWVTVMAKRATAILQRFQDSESNAVIQQLQKLAEKFSSGVPFSQCLKEMKDVFETFDGVSSFELASSNLLTEFADALKRHPHAVIAVIDIFTTLTAVKPTENIMSPLSPAPGSPQTPFVVTPLLRLVRLLQSVVAQFENFPLVNTGGLRSLNAQIRLKLIPDSSMTAEESEGSKSSHKTASVNIEPLATIGAVADFIQSRLLHNASPPKPPTAEEGDDEPEEILPEVPKSGNSKSKRKGEAPTRSAPLYIRFKNHLLNERLSMVQVMKRFVEPFRAGQPKPPAKPLPAGLPKHLQEAFSLAASAGEEVELWYSTTPFPSSVVSETTEGSRQTLGPEGIHIDFKHLTAGASEIAFGLSKPLSCFADAPAQSLVRDSLILLRAISAGSRNLASLAEYCTLTGLEGPAEALKAATPILAEEFINAKLNNKILKQLTNPLLAGQLEDSWCVSLGMDCPFLFPPSTRRLLFDVTFHGTSRALARLQERLQEVGEQGSMRPHRVQRMKLRVWRERILDCARQISEQFGNSRYVFEMEFYREEGSGLGPTQEFYALLGKELVDKRLGLWREAEDDTSESSHHSSALGVFPKPVLNPGPEILGNFRFLGRMLARALLDRRLLNIRLSKPFLKILHGDPIVFDDLSEISPSVYKILSAMVPPLSTTGKDDNLFMMLNGQRVLIESLGLTFSLSGKEDILLAVAGDERLVKTREDALEYVERTLSTLFKAAVEDQIKTLVEAFDELLPIRSLRLLELDDVAILFSGHEQKVTLAELEAFSVQDHGYNANSFPVRALFEVIDEMSLEEQKQFFQFLTGSPKLPVGGLGALRPKLTIVRKTSSSPKIPETAQLPSAMTCQNFLKLPAYETKEQLKKKLFLAIEEGRHGFNFT